jgi:hypothetical protein
VGGPTCEFKISQGLLKERAAAAPWILDPTAASARVRRGPRRAPGARVHGGPPFQNEGVCDQSRSCEIRRPWTCACGMRRRRRRSAAARGGSSPALALDGVPSHQSDHEVVQNDVGTLAHVTGGSMGAIVPHRRPASEGGGVAAPASLWMRCCARKEGKMGGENCSQFKGVAGELEGEEDATAAKLGNGGGSGGAPVWSRRGSHGLWGREPAANRA